jgi:hypothetical protein
MMGAGIRSSGMDEAHHVRVLAVIGGKSGLPQSLFG